MHKLYIYIYFNLYSHAPKEYWSVWHQCVNYYFRWYVHVDLLQPKTISPLWHRTLASTVFTQTGSSSKQKGRTQPYTDAFACFEVCACTYFLKVQCSLILFMVARQGSDLTENIARKLPGQIPWYNLPKAKCVRGEWKLQSRFNWDSSVTVMKVATFSTPLSTG